MTKFDAESISALLQRTEANLRKTQPAHDFASARSGRMNPSLAVDYSAATQVPAEPVARRQQLEELELEAQIVQLRVALQGLEKRMTMELQAFGAVCNKRLQAKEEHLRSLGAGLQDTVDGALESLSRRVESKLRDVERASVGRVDTSLDEIWQSLRRLQADSSGLQGQLQGVAGADDVGQRLAEATQRLQKHLDDKLLAFERRSVEQREALEGSTVAWREAMNQRCRALETQIWDSQAQRGDVTDAILKRLPEAAPLREAKDELERHTYEMEIQGKRIFACEGRLSKLQALEAKVEFAEETTANHVEEHAQRTHAVEDLVQRVAQRTNSMEALVQRTEARTQALDERLQDIEHRVPQMANSAEAAARKMEGLCRNLEARFCVKTEEDTEQAARSLAMVEEKAQRRISDVENMCQRQLFEANTQHEARWRELKSYCEVFTQALAEERDARTAAQAQHDSELSSVQAKAAADEKDLRQQLIEQKFRVEKLQAELNQARDTMRAVQADIASAAQLHDRVATLTSVLEETQGHVDDLKNLCHTTAQATEEEIQHRANVLEALSKRAQSLREDALGLKSNLGLEGLDASWQELDASWEMAGAGTVQTHRFTFQAANLVRLLGEGRGEMLQRVHAELLRVASIGPSDVEAIWLGASERADAVGFVELRVMLRNYTLSQGQIDQILAFCESVQPQ